MQACSGNKILLVETVQLECDQNFELEFDQETLGNKNLDAESSEAINIGASWNLTEDLQFTIDYWKYSHEDIVDVDANTTLGACVAGTAPVVSDEADLNGPGPWKGVLDFENEVPDRKIRNMFNHTPMLLGI